MQLLDHVSITVRDAIGFGERNRPHDGRHSYISVYASPAAAPDARRHVCFRAASEGMVKAFHAAGLRNYHPGYFAAFLRDPDGNKIEAVFTAPAPR
jgi:catechol 2,3-dioxygenase-like lactoylglutathione lyase family enzyme